MNDSFNIHLDDSKDLLEASLLSLLKNGKFSGYELNNQMDEFDFYEEPISSSTVYRELKKMEKEELILFKWEDLEDGTQERIYEITNFGLKHLDQWIFQLKKKKEHLDLIIQKYEEFNLDELIDPIEE